MMQRHHFAKGYMVHSPDPLGGDRQYIRVEESYDGQGIEFLVGNDDQEDCDCESDDCTQFTEHRVTLNREQVKELMFCLKQLHFIDKEN